MNLVQQGLVRARSQQQSVSGEHKTHSANFLNKYKGNHSLKENINDGGRQVKAKEALEFIQDITLKMPSNLQRDFLGRCSTATLFFTLHGMNALLGNSA